MTAGQRRSSTSSELGASRLVGAHQVLGEPGDLLDASHLALEQRQLHHVHIVIEILDLRQILRLDLRAGRAHRAVTVATATAAFRIEQLVDDDVVHVDALHVELLHEALGLVQAQELGDAHAHERRLVGVLELVGDFLHERHLLLQ